MTYYTPTPKELEELGFKPVGNKGAYIILLNEEDIDSDDCIVWRPNSGFRMTNQTIGGTVVKKIFPKTKEDLLIFIPPKNTSNKSF